MLITWREKHEIRNGHKKQENKNRNADLMQGNRVKKFKYDDKIMIINKM